MNSDICRSGLLAVQSIIHTTKKFPLLYPTEYPASNVQSGQNGAEPHASKYESQMIADSIY